MNRENSSRDGGRKGDREELDVRPIVLAAAPGEPLNPDLFDTIAEQVAKVIGANTNGNKPSQVRQFYNEVVMWDEKIRQSPESFAECLPFIRMIKAKAAYAQGRKNVDDNFVLFISRCLDQVTDGKSLHNFKLFFEAFIGFYKLHNPKG